MLPDDARASPVGTEVEPYTPVTLYILATTAPSGEPDADFAR